MKYLRKFNENIENLNVNPSDIYVYLGSLNWIALNRLEEKNIDVIPDNITISHIKRICHILSNINLLYNAIHEKGQFGAENPFNGDFISIFGEETLCRKFKLYLLKDEYFILEEVCDGYEGGLMKEIRYFWYIDGYDGLEMIFEKMLK